MTDHIIQPCRACKRPTDIIAQAEHNGFSISCVHCGRSTGIQPDQITATADWNGTLDRDRYFKDGVSWGRNFEHLGKEELLKEYKEVAAAGIEAGMKARKK